MWIFLIGTYFHVSISSSQFSQVAEIILLEECLNLVNENSRNFSENPLSAWKSITSSLLESANLEIVNPWKSLELLLASLQEFLEKPVNQLSCHVSVASWLLKASELVFYLNSDLPRMRLLVQWANLFKLAGIRNWFKRLTEDREHAPKYLPNAKLFTEIDISLRNLDRVLGVQPRELITFRGARKPKIDLFSFCVYGKNDTLTNLTGNNHQAYAYLFGLRHRMISEIPSLNTDPQFYKILLVKYWLESTSSSSSSDWLLYVDCDALFTNPTFSVFDLIETYGNEDVHFIVAEDNGGINTGVMLIRKSDYSLLFFSNALRHSQFPMSWDQSMIFWEITRNSNLFSNIHEEFEYPPKGISLVHQMHLNAFHEGTAKSWNTYAWKEGDFIKHFAGCPWDELFCFNLMMSSAEHFKMKILNLAKEILEK